MEKQYIVSILRPAGNETALIEGIPSDELRKIINSKLMKLYPTLEQVGFYSKTSATTAQLEMAGGEFCGNALRSLAFLLLGNKIGTMSIRSSSVETALTTGIKIPNSSYAEMPIFSSFDRVKNVSDGLTQVEIKGITHLIMADIPSLNEESLKQKGKELLGSRGLLKNMPAAGVMFLSTINGEYSIRPVVWVRDIETLFLETACASGTTAVGLWDTMQSKKGITKLKVKQPSGMSLTIQVEKDSKGFIDATIEGPIEVIKTFNFST